jgi:amino acid adenylation domain-containing protein/non-ribosomal peptide synthase protein (TIGR01720 family)
MTNAEQVRAIEGYLFPLSSAQKRIWFLTQLRPEDFSYNVPLALHIKGRLNRTALAESLREIIRRHEILRTGFVLVDDEPMQVIPARFDWEMGFEGPSKDADRLSQSQVIERLRELASRPFDLAQSPLVRAILYQLDAEEHILFLNLHHIVCDGWSLGILVRELSALYPFYCRSAEATAREALPEVEFQYADYSEWHREWLQSDEIKPHLSYWKQKLGGILPRLEMPTDHPRPSVATHAGAVVHKLLDGGIVGELQRFSIRSEATLFMTMLAAFLALLHRYSGSEDIIVGTPAANRLQPAFENTFGLFVNSLALRTELSGAWSFNRLLEQVRKDCLEAYGHQDLPFEMLVEQLQAERSSAFSPVFQIMFALQNAPLGEIDWPGLDVTPLRISNGSSKLDLTLIAEETADGLVLTLEYATDLFLEETATRILDHYVNLLSAAAGRPQQRIRELSLLGATEPKLLQQSSPVATLRFESSSLVEMFEDVALRYPYRTALSDGDKQLTFQELNTRANQLARLLRSRGVSQEHIVGLCLDRSPELIISMLAILKAGAAYLPLDPRYPTQRLSFLLLDSHPQLVISHSTASHSLPDLEGALLLLDELDSQLSTFSEENLHLEIDPRQAAYIIYTSGSTGEPKGCIVTHHNVTRLMRATEEQFSFSEQDVWTLFHSASFDFSVWEVWGALLYGGRLVIVDYWTTRSPDSFYELLAREQVTVLNQTPSAFRQLMEVEAQAGEHALLEAKALPELSLRLVIFGGEALDLPSLRPWFSRHGDERPQLVNMYGITETTVHVTHRVIRQSDCIEGRASLIGEPISDVQLHLLDEGMRRVPVGVRGEIYVGGAGVGRGYWERAELTAERFVPDPFGSEPGQRLYRSGDVGRRRADGELEYLGRADQQVKIRGFRIEVGEVEACIRGHAGVGAAVVLATGKDGAEKRLVCYVSRRAGVEPVSVEELRGHVAERLPEHMMPAAFVILEELPLNENGKVDRRALAAVKWRAEREEAEAKGDQPEGELSEIEERLAEIWREVLGVERVGRADNFFGLGGDSILALQVAAKARRRKLVIYPQDVLRHQTIQELAEVAEQAEKLAPATKGVGEVPLTPIQNWFFDLAIPRRSHWNQSIAVELKQAIPERDMEAALRAIANTHSAFGLRFRREGAQWLQRYAEEEAEIPLSVVDLSNLEATRQEAALSSNIAAIQESLDIENGPLARAVYFHLNASNAPVLFLTMHHLIADGVSWRILMEDLAEVLSQRREQKPMMLGAASESFGEWAQRLQRAAADTELLKEADYWLADQDDCASRLPTDYPAGPEENTEGSKAVVSSVVQLHEPSGSDRGARAQTRGMELLLLASVAKLCAQITGHDRFRIAMEDHGRRELGEAVDVSRTTGWFTALYPLVLRGCDESDPGLLLDSIERQLEGLPRHGLGYGLLRYSTYHPEIRERLSQLPEPQISFNYLGQLQAGRASGQLFKLRRDLASHTHSGDALRPFAIDLVAFVDEGKLQIDWLFSERLHKRSTIEGWAQLLTENLSRFLEEPGGSGRRFSPSDFPLSGLSRAALDKLAEFAPDNIEDIYPLSPMQQGMLFHTVSDDHERFYFEQITAEVTGQLSMTAFRQAWQDVIDRHQALRTCFLWEGLENPVQVVLRQTEAPLRHEDWRALSEQEQAAQFDMLLRDDKSEEFILSQCPLLRLALVRTREDSWRLLWSYHHMLLDGWSLPVIFLELLGCYEARAGGRKKDLARPPQFRDYIAWLLRQDMKSAQTFWRGMLEGFTPIRIEGRKTTAEGGNSECGEEQFTLDQRFYSELQEFAHRHHLTLNTIVQGAWALLLCRYGCGDDVVFGSTVSGRTAELPEIERAVGLFINTLPMRIRIDRQQQITPWLRQIQAQQFETHAYSYCRLADIQRWSGVYGNEALFESLVVFENYPVDEAVRSERHSLSIADIHILERTNYPLTLAAIPASTLTLKLDYHASRFSRTTVSRMLAELRRLLTTIVGSASDTVGRLLRRVAVESDSLTNARAVFVTSFPAPACAHQLFEEQALSRPAATALAAGATEMSYEELNKRANQLAARLQREGVGPESVVGLLLTRSSDLVVAILAVLKAGGAYLPLDPLYPQDRLRYMLSDSDASLLLTRSELSSLLAATPCPRILLDAEALALGSESTANPGVNISPTNLAYIIYTSGTTGKPKGVAVTHAGIEGLAVEQAEIFEIDDESRVYQFASPSFDAFVSEIFVTLSRGATLCLPETGNDADWQDLTKALCDSQATHVTLPPSVLSALAPAPTLKTLVVAGEAGSLELFRQWSEHCRVINAYGPTEATVCASMKSVTDSADKAPTLGKALRGTSLYLLSSELEPVPVGVTGEIYVGGNGLARGYLHQPELTAAVFIPDPFTSIAGARLYRTGDLGVMDEDGEIRFLGRRDHQVKLRGYRIELAEIEAVLAAHRAVEMAVAVVRETSAQTRQLVAYIVCRPGSSVTVEELRQYASERLPAYEVPGRFIQLDSLPLTPNKKIDRIALACASVETPVVEAARGPQTKAEHTLSRIWAEVLRVPEVGVQDNYFELGGDSILSLQIASRAREAALEITPREIMTLQTIERIAHAVREIVRPQIELDVDCAPFALTPIQRWFFESDWPARHQWNQSITIEAAQPMDALTLGEALRAVFIQHDALRLRFVETAEGWKQFYQADAATPVPEWFDLSALSPGVALAEFQRIAADAQTGFDLEQGPLFRALYLQLPEGERDRLLLVAHHLITDAFSWATILEDLLRAYQQQTDGRPSSLPVKSSSYKSWAERLAQSADSRLWRDEANFWLDLASHSALSFPTDFPPVGNDLNIMAHREVVARGLTSSYTSALLRDSRSAYNTSVEELLLTALAQAVAEYTASSTILLDLESHGREALWDDLDISRAVGWFTSLYPVRLTLPSIDAGPRSSITAVKEQLRAIPRQGMGYGVLRYLSGDTVLRRRLAALPVPPISFNYLGSTDAAFSLTDSFRLSPIQASNEQHREQPIPHLLEINAFVRQGELTLNFSSSERLFRRSTVNALADQFLYKLQLLIDHCQSPDEGAYTPSDFSGIELSAEDLDAILDDVSS